MRAASGGGESGSVKEISYADQHIVTSDEIADRVLDYAKLVAIANTADRLSLPAVDSAGSVHTVNVLIGPASQISAAPYALEAVHIPSEATLTDIEERIRAVQPQRASIADGVEADAYDPDLPWAEEA